jgi:hypothetical protein
MTVAEIVSVILKDHDGEWEGLFNTSPNGLKFLPTGEIVTPFTYSEVRRAFMVEPPLTPEERRKNDLRARVSRHE